MKAIINPQSQITNDIINPEKCASGNTSPLKGDLGVKIINKKHLAFAKRYLKGSTQAEAYQQVYKCSHANAKARGSELCKRPEIAAYLEQYRLMDYEDTATELAEHNWQKKMDIDMRRQLLAGIAMGQRTYNRHYHVRGELITKADELPPNALLRAIELDAKLEAGWYDRKPLPKLTPEEKQLQKAAEQKSKEEEEQKKARRMRSYCYFAGTKSYNYHPDFTPLEEKALWQLSLKHEAIDAAATPLDDKYLDCGCTTKRDMNTGKFYIECLDTPAYQKIPNKSPKVTDEDRQPLTEEQLADIIKNNPVITAALNNELTIVLRPGSSSDKKEGPVKLWAERQEANRTDAGTIADTDIPDYILAAGSHNTFPTLPKPARAGTDGERMGVANKTSAKPSTLEPDLILSPSDKSVVYRPVKEIWEEHWKTYVNHYSQKNHAKYLEVFTMYKGMTLPPEKRKTIELKSPWEFHPQNPSLMRKKSA